MTKREKSQVLGYGEYYRPGRDDYAVQHGRILFLEWVRAVAPDAMRSLYALFPDFLNAVAALRDVAAGVELRGQWPQDEDWARWIQDRERSVAAGEQDDLSASTLEKVRRYAEFRSKFDQWAAKWHLTDDWAQDEACKTLLHWEYLSGQGPSVGRSEVSEYRVSYVPDIRLATGDVKVDIEVPKWCPAMPSSGTSDLDNAEFTPEEIRFTFEHPGWHPIFIRWADAEKSITAAFQAELSKYRARLLALAEGRGLEPSPRKYRDKKRGINQHFEWTARYQCLEETYDAIAGELSIPGDDESVVSGETVGKAVRATAKRIGLTLRVENIGRRRFKQRNRRQ